MRRDLWLLNLLCVLAYGCSNPSNNTKIFVVVRSDLAVPTEIDTVVIDVKTLAGTFSITRPLTAAGEVGKTKLPVVVALVPPDNESLAFEVKASAFRGLNFIVAQNARSSFTSGQSRVLTLFLGRACENIVCGLDTTCSAGSCGQPITVDPRSLPTYDPATLLLPPDAGLVPELRDGSVDSGGAGTDTGTIDGNTDAGPTDDSAADLPADVPAPRAADVPDASGAGGSGGEDSASSTGGATGTGGAVGTATNTNTNTVTNTNTNTNTSTVMNTSTNTNTITNTDTNTNTVTAMATNTITNTATTTITNTNTSTVTNTSTNTNTATTTTTLTTTNTTVTTYEAENLAHSASAAGYGTQASTSASNGMYVQFDQSKTPVVGDYIQFTLARVPAGTYTVDFYYRGYTTRGINQASIDGTDIGTNTDEYYASYNDGMHKTLGSRTLTAGDHLMRFRITGTGSSLAPFYSMTIDKIVLTRTSYTGP